MDTLKKIGKYKYGQRHCLGEGSFGKVYEGFDESGKRVAIKKIEQKMIATDAYLKQSLSTEIAVMKKLKHRNIVELIDTVTTANSIYLILQFCKDGDLKRYSMNKRFTQDQALQILKQLIEGFSAITKEKLIHRDLKPANVLVHDGVFKICDFGFAKYFGQLNKMAKTCVGTPIYMSPQVLKQKPYSQKSDIWSLGVMYYELLFGKIPFLGKSEDEIFKIITRGKLVIPKCSEQSYIFLKNTLVIDEKERWDWDAVFEHFGVKQNTQKPAFYQNFVNLLKGQNKEATYKKPTLNHSQSFQRKQNQIMNFKDRNDIRYGVQRNSPDKDDNYKPKGKHYKMAINNLALDGQRDIQRVSPIGLEQPLRRQEPNIRFERVYKPEETQKARWLYNITINFLLREPYYSINIPSFQEFLCVLATYSFEEYLRQLNPANIAHMNRIKRIVLEQQKQSLGKVIQQIKRFPPCSNIKGIASIVQLQGTNFLTPQELKIIKDLDTLSI